MSEEEIRLFEEKLKSIPKIESMKPPITSMDSIDINELINAVKRFKCLPSKTTLIESNNSLNWQVEKLQQENNQLKENLKLEKQISNGIARDYEILLNQKKELRSWLEEYKENTGNSLDSYDTGIADCLEDVIRKLNELEEIKDEKV